MEPTYAGYEYLLSYKLSTVIYDCTVQYVEKWVSHYSRTGDQMVQAGRSGRQNIAEGYSEESLKIYIKLAGVALGSQVELLKDFEDQARQNAIKFYSISQAKQIREVREVWELINKDLINEKPFACHGKIWKPIIVEIEKQIVKEKRKSGLLKYFDAIEECAEYIIKNTEFGTQNSE